MAELLTYTGIDLPVFSPETPIAWTKQQIANIGQTVGATAVRRVFFTPSSLTSLQAVVETADALFDDVAELCEATVVPHSWGLARRPESLQSSISPLIRQPLLPVDMELVAEVDIIRASRLPSRNEAREMRAKLRRRELSRPYVDWRDDHTHQFLHGTNAADHRKGMWLVDIEPVLRIRSD